MIVHNMTLDKYGDFILKPFYVILLIMLLLPSMEVSAQQKKFDIELCSDVFEYNGEVYFCGNHRRYGKELFRSNGTTEGTYVVADISIGSSHSKPGDFFILRGLLYFFAETKLRGREIWRTDGTVDGTKRITDAYPGPDGFPSDFGYMYPDGEVVYLSTADGLWRTNGLSSGTVKLIEPNLSGAIASMGGYLYYFNSPTLLTDDRQLNDKELKLYRLSNDSLLAEEVKNFGNACGAGHLSQVDKNVASGRFYFEISCVDSNFIFTYSIYATDGTALGTKKVIDGNAYLLGDLNGQRYFYSFSSKGVLYTDGTMTEILDVCATKECTSGFSVDNDTFDGSSMVINNKLIFNLNDTALSESIWATDGKANGSMALTGGGVFDYAKNENLIIFRFNPGFNDDAVWSTDGTVNGTKELKKVENGDARGVYSIGNRFLMFFNNSNSRNSELWSSTGTPASNRKLATFTGWEVELYRGVVEGNRFYFTVGDLLWHTNGQVGGTYKITYLDDVIETMREKNGLPAIMDLLLNDGDETSP